LRLTSTASAVHAEAENAIDEFTNDQSANYATLLGLENWNGGKTGYVLLIDAKTKKVLGKISKQASPTEMKAALTKCLCLDHLRR